MAYQRNILLLFVLFIVSISLKAQNMPVDELNENMRRFYKGCMMLREGIEQKNVITLDKAIDLLDVEPQNPDRLELSNLRLESLDTTYHCPMDGHLYYNARYAEFYKENMGLGTYKEAAESLRGAPSSCQIAHRAVKANGKISYKIMMSGDCQVFVVAEPGGRINAKVEILNENEHPGVVLENGSVSYIKWEMNPFPPKQVILTIENKSDKDISFVIASN